MFDLSTYSVVLLVHIMSGIVLVGSSLFTPLTRREIASVRTLDRLREWLAFAARSTRANGPAAMLLLATGVYLGSTGWWSQGWFYVAVGAWFFSLILAMLFVKPSAIAVGRAAAEAGNGPVTEAIDRLRRSRRWEVAEGVMLGNDLAMLYVMFMKPSLAESLLVVGVAGAACVGLESMLTRRRSQLEPASMEAPAAELP